MKIAVLSGKGGTGKTLLSVNLACVLDNSTYIDCDVEEPNGKLFFKPSNIKKQDINIYLPKHNEELCDGCKKCVEFCKFNALAYVKNKLIVFDEVCHSCNGCLMVCPNNAISLRSKKIGVIEEGYHNNIKVKSGILNIGEASGIPIIKELLTNNNDGNIVIDCPPGSACSVMESIKDADYCVLVTEPTSFGVHNLQMVYELVKLFNKKFGVILNKCVDGENIAKEFCLKNNAPIIGKIDWDLDLATISTNAQIAVEVNDKYKALFNNIAENIMREVQR